MVENLVRGPVEGMGLSLWDVRFEKEGPAWYLKVLVDRPGGVMDTDTCEAVSRAVDPLLDEADPIEQSYFLEVGSPGLGRRLTRPEHFAAMAGRKVRAKLYAPGSGGGREPAGNLVGLENGVVTIQTEDGAELAIPLKMAALWKLCDDEDLFN